MTVGAFTRRMSAIGRSCAKADRMAEEVPDEGWTFGIIAALVEDSLRADNESMKAHVFET
jgi:hypothetical protein